MNLYIYEKNRETFIKRFGLNLVKFNTLSLIIHMNFHTNIHMKKYEFSSFIEEDGILVIK